MKRVVRETDNTTTLSNLHPLLDIFYKVTLLYQLNISLLIKERIFGSNSGK